MSVSDTSALQHGIGDYEPDGHAKNEYISDIIRLPGYWEAKESCLELKPTGFCTAGHVQLGSAVPCGTRTCPHHWYQWRRRAAIKAVVRLAATRYLAGGPTDRSRRMLHLINSPPQDQRWTAERFWQQRSESYDRAADVGARGGVFIPHAYRASDEGNRLWKQAVAEGYIEPEFGKWRFFRESSETWEELKPLVEVGPHGHHFALAKNIDGEAVQELEAETGWMTKNVRSLAPFYVDESEVPPWELVDGNGRIVRERSEVVREGYEDMARLTLYLLSHAAVQPKTGELPQRNTVTTWGDVHQVTPSEDLPGEVLATIVRRAEAAVGGELPAEVGGLEGRRGCAREGCEAPVEPLSRLEDYLSNVGEFEGWFEGLDAEQQFEIWGLRVHMSDRPPPGTGPPGEEARTLPPGGFQRSPSATAAGVPPDEADFLEWLRQLGRSRISRATVLDPTLA